MDKQRKTAFYPNEKSLKIMNKYKSEYPTSTAFINAAIEKYDEDSDKVLSKLDSLAIDIKCDINKIIERLENPLPEHPEKDDTALEELIL